MGLESARSAGRAGFAVAFMAFLMASGAAILPAQAALDAKDGETLLAKADRALAPSDSRFTMRMENSGGGRSSWSEYECYNRGSNRFLMLFKAPASLAGQAMLKVDDTIYHYVRKVDKTMQSSAKAQFANTLFTQEDVLSRQLSALYRVASVEEREVDGLPAYLLSLSGKGKDAVYREIRVFLSRETGFPLRREYYSHSGQLVKRLTIDALELDGEGRPKRIEMTMADTIRKGYSTRAVLDFTQYAAVDERYFSRAYLKVVTE